jgi:YfaZ precursor
MIFSRYTQIIALFSASLLSTPITLAGTLDFNVNNDAVTGQLSGQPLERPEISLLGGFFYHQDDGHTLSVGALLSDPVEHEQDYRPWAKVGLKAVAFESDERNGDSSGSAIAPGGMLTFFVPNIQDLYIDFIGFFAPEVLAFGDSDRYWEASARLTYQLMSTADIYLGYQHIEFSREERRRRQNEITLDDSFHVGAVLRF